MDRPHNPFAAEDSLSNINIDKLAEQMVQTLKNLQERKQAPPVQPSPNPPYNQLSEHSFSLTQTLKNEPQASQDGGRRDRPVRILTLGRKKGNGVSEGEGSVRGADSLLGEEWLGGRSVAVDGEKLKMQFREVQVKEVKEVTRREEEDQKLVNNNPGVKNIREVLSKKRKNIEEIEAQVEKLREKYLKIKQQNDIKLETQTNILIDFMSQKYTQRIYKFSLQRIKQKTGNDKKDKNEHFNKILLDVSQKLELFRNEKGTHKKTTKNKFTNQQSYCLQAYGQERQSYLNAWKKKLQAQKTSLEKQVSKTSFYDDVQLPQQSYYPVPQFLLDQDGNRQLFDKTYLPLYCRHDPENIASEHFHEIRCLNVKSLQFENVLFCTFPKSTKMQKRLQIKSHLKKINEKTIQLTQQTANSLFINITMFTHFCNVSQEYLVLGRGVLEQDLPTVSLQYLGGRYDGVPEILAKYIIKCLVRALQRVKRECGFEPIIFPDNIILNQRNEIRIDNFVANEIYRFAEFAEPLLKDKYLYLPPEWRLSLYSESHACNGMASWSVGVILFEMLFNKKPFTYGSKATDYEQFYVMYEIEFPSKPAISQACKQLIKLCLSKPQTRPSFQKILRHHFFQLKK